MRQHRRWVWAAVAALVAVAAPAGAQVDRGGRKVSGTVVSAATQQAVVNAAVRYEEAGQAPQTTTTDSKGYFELSAGRLGVVTVTAGSYGTARRRWPPPTGARTLLVALTPPAILRGSVTDLVTGRPVAARVNVLVKHPGNFVVRAVTAPEGEFELTDLPSGPAAITARSEGFAPFVGSTTVEGGKVRDTRISLLLEAQAGGHVRDHEGNPVQGAYVSATYPELAGAGLVESFIGGWPTTGQDGAFSLSGLVPNTAIALQAELGDRRSAAQAVSIGPGMRRLDIVLTLLP